MQRVQRLYTSLWFSRILLLMALMFHLAVLDVLVSRSPAWGAPAGAETPSPSPYMMDGLQAFQRGDIERAAADWQQAAQVYAAAGQPRAHRVALTHLARAYEALGHADRARDSLRTALKLAETAGDQPHVALLLGRLGELALATGNLQEAERLAMASMGSDSIARSHETDLPTIPAISFVKDEHHLISRL